MGNYKCPRCKRVILDDKEMTCKNCNQPLLMPAFRNSYEGNEKFKAYSFTELTEGPSHWIFRSKLTP